MGRKEKLILGFMNESAKNKTYKDLKALVSCLGCYIKQGNGSRFKVYDKNNRKVLELHRKGSNENFKEYEIKYIREMIKLLEGNQ